MKDKNNKIYKRLKDFPFSPVKWPFYYGWVIIFAGIVGVLMSVPGQTIGVSAFTDHLIDDLHIGRVSLSLAYMAGTIISGFCISYAGRLYDRYGVRPVAIVSGFLMGVTLIYLSGIERVSSFVISVIGFVEPAALLFVLLTAGFFMLRFLGQGVLTMVSRNMVMKWFEKRRGFANAILGVSISFGFSYSPRVLNAMISSFSWQTTWLILGIIAGIAFVVFAFVFFRDNPMIYGLVPDGRKSKEDSTKQEKAGTYRDYTLREARATYTFWIFNLTLALQALYITAFTFHVVSIFEVSGYDHRSAITVFFPASIVAVSFNFGGNWLSDYFKLKYFLLLQLFGMMISMTAIIFLEHSGYFRWVLIGGNGIMQGMFGVLSVITWPRFFGLKHLGAISGYAMGWLVVSSALGPFIFSLSHRFTGEYDIAAAFCIVIAITLFILGFRAENVKKLKA